MRNLIFRCNECAWSGPESEILRAPNPFQPEDSISGCPKCGCVGDFTNLCDEPGCTDEAGCGFPTESGYRRTCGKHWAASEAGQLPTEIKERNE